MSKLLAMNREDGISDFTRYNDIKSKTATDTNAQIMLSAYHGHANIVRLLLQHGADPNSLNDRGQSPLAGVVFKNEKECIEALLEGGADPEIGQPNAIAACQVFKQEAYEALFREQVDKLRASGSRAVNGHS